MAKFTAAAARFSTVWMMFCWTVVGRPPLVKELVEFVEPLDEVGGEVDRDPLVALEERSH